MSEDTNFTKGDVERIVRDLAGPIAKQVAAETAKAVAGELIAKVSGDMTKAMGDVTKAMTDTIADSFRILGMDRSSEAGIARAHQRNAFVDQAIAERKDFQARMTALDEIITLTSREDRVFLRQLRTRAETNDKTIRETIIRYLVPLAMGAAGVSGFHWLTDKAHPSTQAPATVIERPVERPEPAAGTPAASK